MAKSYRILVFGKEGCDKCKALNKRLDDLLETEPWTAFEKEYVDVMSEEGLVAFSKQECLNPQRIPAFVVAHKKDGAEDFEPVPNRKIGVQDAVCKDSRLYHHLGLQTDYTEAGKGLITPKMITAVLQEALEP